KEVEGLPEELLTELSLSESDKIDYTILSLVSELGGVATLDRLLVSLYQETKEIFKRATLNARIYRLIQKGLLHSVPGKKGVYSERELSEEEVQRLS
ncbi:MAG: hypothetical protein PVF65_12305, partial [Sphingomonadales bacterium]